MYPTNKTKYSRMDKVKFVKIKTAFKNLKEYGLLM